MHTFSRNKLFTRCSFHHCIHIRHSNNSNLNVVPSARVCMLTSKVLDMTEQEQTFRISGIKEESVPSILREFSAPVKLIHPQQTPEEMAFLMAYDSDPVNKWMAARSLATPILLRRASKGAQNQPVAPVSRIPEYYLEALRTTLTNRKIDNALKVCCPLNYLMRAVLSGSLRNCSTRALLQQI